MWKLHVGLFLFGVMWGAVAHSQIGEWITRRRLDQWVKFEEEERNTIPPMPVRKAGK